MPGCGGARLVVIALSLKRPGRFRRKASWRSGYAEDCKSLHPGSIPGEASNRIIGADHIALFPDLTRYLAPGLRWGQIFPGVREPIHLPDITLANFRVVPGGDGRPGEGWRPR